MSDRNGIFNSPQLMKSASLNGASDRRGHGLHLWMDISPTKNETVHISIEAL